MRSNIEDARIDRPKIQNLKFTTGVLPDAASTLTFGHPTVLTCTPTATRIITLPDDDDPTYYGSIFIIRNASAGLFDLTINDEAAATLGTISQNELGLIVLDHLGVWRVGTMTTT